MISYDAEALYPSIPFKTYLDIIKKKIEKHKIIKKVTKITTKDIKDSMELGLTSQFTYNNKLYNIENSEPIGLSLMVTITNIYI